MADSLLSLDGEGRAAGFSAKPTIAGLFTDNYFTNGLKA